MQSGEVEVRLLRGAGGIGADGGTTGQGGDVFAVFALFRKKGPCAY